MVVQCSRRSGLAGKLCRDEADAGTLKAQINKTDRNDARGIAQQTCANVLLVLFQMPERASIDLQHLPRVI